MSPGHWVGGREGRLWRPHVSGGACPELLHVLFCVCPLLRAQCHGRGGGGRGTLVTAWASPLPVQPSYSPWRGRGQAAGNTGFSRGLEPPIPQPPEGSRLHQCVRDLSQEEVPPAVNAQSQVRPGCALTPDAAGEALHPPNPASALSSSREPRDLSPGTRPAAWSPPPCVTRRPPR